MSTWSKLLIAFVMGGSFFTAAEAECISKSSIVNMENVGSGAILVETTRGAYDFSTTGWCDDQQGFDIFGLDTMSGFFVCEGDSVLVIDRFSRQIKDSCTILMITPRGE